MPTIQLTKTANNSYTAKGYEHLPINWNGLGEDYGGV